MSHTTGLPAYIATVIATRDTMRSISCILGYSSVCPQEITRFALVNDKASRSCMSHLSVMKCLRVVVDFVGGGVEGRNVFRREVVRLSIGPWQRLHLPNFFPTYATNTGDHKKHEPDFQKVNEFGFRTKASAVLRCHASAIVTGRACASTRHTL